MATVDVTAATAAGNGNGCGRNTAGRRGQFGVHGIAYSLGTRLAYRARLVSQCLPHARQGVLQMNAHQPCGGIRVSIQYRLQYFEMFLT